VLGAWKRGQKICVAVTRETRRETKKERANRGIFTSVVLDNLRSKGGETHEPTTPPPNTRGGVFVLGCGGWGGGRGKVYQTVCGGTDVGRRGAELREVEKGKGVGDEPVFGEGERAGTGGGRGGGRKMRGGFRREIRPLGVFWGESHGKR